MCSLRFAGVLVFSSCFPLREDIPLSEILPLVSLSSFFEENKFCLLELTNYLRWQKYIIMYPYVEEFLAYSTHFFSGQINQTQSLFTYAQNESVETFAKSDFTPMFVEDITWYNNSVRELAEAQCGNDIECLFDAAATNDVSIGIVTKDINIQLVNESNTLGKLLKM